MGDQPILKRIKDTYNNNIIIYKGADITINNNNPIFNNNTGSYVIGYPSAPTGMTMTSRRRGGLTGLRDWYNMQSINVIDNIGDLRSWYNDQTFYITTQYYDGAQWIDIATTDRT